jgi:Zn-dependent protease with chaperone function
MLSPGESLLYAPVVVWAATGLGLIFAFRRSTPVLLLRLAAAFLALWALLATTALVYVLANGGWSAIANLWTHPLLLFSPIAFHLWIDGAIGAVLVLGVGFALNQLVGRAMLGFLAPRPLAWPRRLPHPSTPTFLGRFSSPRAEAFSFTLLARGGPGRGPVARREVILVSEQLLDLLNVEEQEAVIAHELGHLHALDSRYLTFLRTCARLVRWDPVVAVLASSVTRQEELRADRVAVELTGRPGALASALRKVSGEPPQLPRPLALGLLGSGERTRRARTEERIHRLRQLAVPRETEEA